MITRVKNAGFSNNRLAGKYVEVSFTTLLQNKEGRQHQTRIKAKVHYFEAGPSQGKAILLLHGAMQSSYSFRHNLTALSQTHRVIVPDLLGHGYSDCPDMDYTVEDYALFIEAFANAVGLEKFSVIAVGQSAAYALDFCYYNNRRIEKIVLLSPGAFENTRGAGAASIGGFFGPLVMRRYANKAYVRKYLSRSFFDKTRLKEKDIAERHDYRRIHFVFLW